MELKAVSTKSKTAFFRVEKAMVSKTLKYCCDSIWKWNGDEGCVDLKEPNKEHVYKKKLQVKLDLHTCMCIVIEEYM